MPRLGLEAFVAAACREQLICEPQARSLLGLDLQFELDASLEKRGIDLESHEADLAAERLTLAKYFRDQLNHQLGLQGV